MTQCNGYRRRGEAFTLVPVPVVWSRCEAEAKVIITVRQDDDEEPFTGLACMTCWYECMTTPGMEVIDVRPILEEEKLDATADSNDNP